VLQYVHGLSQLGHEVTLVEPVPVQEDVIASFHRVVSRHGLGGRAALLHGGTRTTGMPYRAVVKSAAAADLLLNLSGVLVDPELTGPVPLRVYIDLDPGFTQLWAAEGTDVRLSGHHRYATVGRSIAAGTSNVPRDAVTWVPMTPPVVLDRWPVDHSRPSYGFTTVGNWRSYGSVWRGTERYGQRGHSMRSLLDLPGRVPDVMFQPALAIDAGETADIRALRSGGWDLIDAQRVAGSPERYQRFIGASTGELGVAKDGYVRASCGWFSDRSACYLASGRPVVAQDTGWSAYYPTGAGLFAFTCSEGAAEAVRDVIGAYDRNRAAARAIAEDVFDAKKVLRQLLTSVGADG
jgi:hypothetical protein